MIGKGRYKNRASLESDIVGTTHYCSIKIGQIWPGNDRRGELATILPPSICLLLPSLTDSTFTNDPDMNQLPLYVQILRALEGVDSDHERAVFEDCKHRTVLCDEKPLSKDTVENKLRPLLPSEVIFLNDRTITHRWDEKGSSCGLFAGPASLELYASIRNWTKDEDCPCNHCKHIVRRMLETVGISGETFIFHLAVRCDSRMVSLIKHMRTLDNTEFTPTTSSWHSLLNADGAPCLHIAAQLGEFAIIPSLLLQKPETLNERFGSRAYTLMHVIARKTSRSPQYIIEFLMSEFRVPCVDMHARALNGRTPLETAFSFNMANAKSIYSLLSSRDQDSLDFSHLLSIIVGRKGHNVDFRIDMIRLITINSKIDMTNAHSSPYIVLIYSVEGNWDQKSTETALAMWKALIVGRVPLNYFDDHGMTPLAVAIENAPSAFLEDLDTLKENEMEQLGLNFLTLDKDGDTPHTLAQRSSDRRILDIVERNTERQSRMPIPDHDPRSAAMAYLIKGDFEKCLKYLDQLPESPWRQCTTARAHLGLSQCELALRAISNLEESSVVQHLKGSIFIKAQNYKKALYLIHDAYSKETRSRERKQLQRRYCLVVLSLVADSVGRLPSLPYELRMHICNTGFE